jgi:hypothetical protein
MTIVFNYACHRCHNGLLLPGNYRITPKYIARIRDHVSGRKQDYALFLRISNQEGVRKRRTLDFGFLPCVAANGLSRRKFKI